MYEGIVGTLCGQGMIEMCLVGPLQPLNNPMRVFVKEVHALGYK